MGMELATGTAVSYEMENANFTDSELFNFVRDALKSVSLGDVDSYNYLIGIIHHDRDLTDDDIALLSTSLKALSGAVSHIDTACHGSLLDAIYRMSMWNYTRTPDVMDALVELIVSLAASNGKLVDSCLDMLVLNFMPPYFMGFLKQPRGLVIKDQVLSRVHGALLIISELVPLAPMRLLPFLNQRMPFITKDEFVIAIYVENLLKIESNEIGRVAGSMIIMTIMDRLIELDVEILWDEITEDSSKGMFSLELEDMEEFVDDAENDYGDLSVVRKRAEGKHAEKLDSLMVLMFEHLDSSAKAERLNKVFEILLQSFQMTVLNTYKSKFAQFVMFYACSLDAERCGVTFAEKLADMFVGNGFPRTKMSAVAYLASYLSRGKFLSLTLVISMLERLVTWCIKYCKLVDGDINPKAHEIFYSGCQAVMYILCFRMKSMLKIPRLKSKLLHMPIEQILKHPLNPLKVCLPSIVEEFLQQSKEARLFNVSKTFDFDNASELSTAFGGHERLDMFFPFDPCMLKKSDRFIRPNYIYWSMVNRDNDDNDDLSEEENEDEDEVDLDNLDKMSITPRIRMPSRIRPSMSPGSL